MNVLVVLLLSLVRNLKKFVLQKSQGEPNQVLVIVNSSTRNKHLNSFGLCSRQSSYEDSLRYVSLKILILFIDQFDETKNSTVRKDKDPGNMNSFSAFLPSGYLSPISTFFWLSAKPFSRTKTFIVFLKLL